MNTRGSIRHSLPTLLIACAILPMLLSACQPASVSTSLPTAQPTATAQPPAPTLPPAATQTPVQPTQPPASDSGDFTLDLTGVANGQAVETVGAVESLGDKFWTQVMPQHRRMTLQGYPDNSHYMQPQIFVYPAADLGKFSQVAGQAATDLQKLLKDKKQGEDLPFLPLINAAQVMHTQVEYLDFKNGKGVRYLTFYSQGILMITNADLFYTFQGLTSDGKYYVAAVLPVSHAELPAKEQISTVTGAEYRDYIAKTTEWLGQQAASSFTPDLAKLDAMVKSIEVK